jgi:CRISPR-associated protein Cmr3
MRIFIEPVEPLLFRTGRPFVAGEYNFAASLFPPTPETLQGALRAAIAVQWGHA